jgi:hypothetical protein
MDTVFHMRGIKSTGGNNRLWQVELPLISDNDKDLPVPAECIREEIEWSNRWYRLSVFKRFRSYFFLSSRITRFPFYPTPPILLLMKSFLSNIKQETVGMRISFERTFR